MDKIFESWPTLADMARDIGESPITVRHWKRRGSIPAKHDTKIVEAAKMRGKAISYESIAQFRAGKNQEATQ